MRRSPRLLAPMLSALSALSAVAVACAPALDFAALTSGGDAADAQAAHDGAPSDSGTDAAAAADAQTPLDGDAAAAFDADGAPPLDAGADANPCANVLAKDDGIYCGKSMQTGFAGGSPNILYACKSSQVSSTQSCSNGCFVAPTSYPDSCDECALLRDGKWCGSEFAGYAARLATVLFTCHTGLIQGSPMACTGGTPNCRPNDGGASCGP